MYTDITMESPECQRLIHELSKQAETKKKREELSDRSFRIWFCTVLEAIANCMGFHIRNVYEVILDAGYSFGKGFKAGWENAKKNSLRYKERNE